MNRVDLPLDLLRAFVCVIDLQSITRAAEALGRSQPAVSLQMRRLETLVEARLIAFEGRQMKVTEEGERLAVYARQLLRLNDEAVSSFLGRSSIGQLRVGLPTDFAVAFLQEAISDVVDSSPGTTIDLTCDLSRRLLDGLHGDDLDIVVALLGGTSNPYLVRTWEERPVWAVASDRQVHLRRPVPVASHPEGCEYRRRMVAALKSAGTDWRIAYTNPEIGGLQRAVAVGLGVTALTRKTLLPGMMTLDASQGFPPLEPIRVGLFYKHTRLSEAGHALVQTLIHHLDEAADRQGGERQ